MNAEMMGMIAYGAFALSGVFGIAMVVLWFYMDVGSVIADLRGWRSKNRTMVKGNYPMVNVDMKTMALEEQTTTALANEVTALLNGYRLVLNEMVVHTEERI